MNPIERFAFREKLHKEHLETFGKIYFCQITLDGITRTEKIKLHAHHIFPAALFPERRMDLSNGVLIRQEFHRSLHENYALSLVPDALMDYVENNYAKSCRYFKNLVLPNGQRFPNAWTALLVSKSLLDWQSKYY